MTRAATGFRRRRSLSGAKVLVTGGSSGVGRAVAVELARRGAHVLVTARRDERLVALAAAAAAAGHGPMHHEAGDITSPDFRGKLITAAADRLGGLDIVVAAAGSGAVGPFRAASPETLTRIMDVDFFAPTELIRVALPLLLRSPDPAIVLVGSILGHHPLPLHSEYCAAKAAITSLATTLRLELALDGVDVLLASLGPTQSEFWDRLIAGRRADWSRGRALSAERTARIMVRALEWRRREVLPGWRAKGFALAARFFPRLVDRVLARRIRPPHPRAPS